MIGNEPKALRVCLLDQNMLYTEKHCRLFFVLYQIHQTRYHPQPLFRHHPSFARQNKKSSTKTHQLHLHESQPKYIATQEKLPLLIIKMIGCDDSDLIRLCRVRDLCVLCYGNVVSLIAKFLTALCLVFWSLSLTTT
jgi:hypothetical protein